MKRLIKRTKSLIKGMPTAVLVSILFHAGLILFAGLLIIIEVTRDPPTIFVPPKLVKTPKMPPRVIRIKKLKPTTPPSAAKITAKIDTPPLDAIQMPDLATAGFGPGISEGSEIVNFVGLPGIGDEDELLGTTNKATGTEFEGMFFVNPDYKDNNSKVWFHEAIGKFVRSGWNYNKLRAQFDSSKTKVYTPHFMIPPIHPVMLPGVFGFKEETASMCCIVYKGKLVYPEDITFRFWGACKYATFVNVDGKEVLLATRYDSDEQPSVQTPHNYNWLKSKDPKHHTTYIGMARVSVGEWITLKAGEPVDMSVMIISAADPHVQSMLMVEVKGEKYPRNHRGSPILPAFQTAVLSRSQMDQIEQYLGKDEITMNVGPIFNDFETSGDKSEPSEETDSGKPALADSKTTTTNAPIAANADDTGIRTWTLANGKTFEAKFATKIAEKVLFKDKRSRQKRILFKELSKEDQVLVQLLCPPKFDINFTKTFRDRPYPETLTINLKPVLVETLLYTFGTRVKQISTGSYNQELKAEYFAIASEFHGRGDRFVLADRAEHTFVPSKENQKSTEFKGKEFEMTHFQLVYGGLARTDERMPKRGLKYAGFLVVITDSRGEIIAHKTSKKWLFEDFESLKKIQRGWYFDKKTFKRVGPTVIKCDPVMSTLERGG